MACKDANKPPSVYDARSMNNGLGRVASDFSVGAFKSRLVGERRTMPIA